MKINVRKTSAYLDVSFGEAGVSFNSGLLNEQESFEYAEEFISAAEDILAICGENKLVRDLEIIREMLRE